ncbi:MAG TPA: FAD:protein FMN transferase [Lutibacter sp.]|nr:FAD:protein FMN transferase [Lutibacter sp.]
MGTRFEISVVAKNETKGNLYIETAIHEIDRIEKLISSWDSNSQTSLINRNAGIEPVIIDLELLELIERSIQISKITNGAFDITYASMDRIWKFDGSMKEMPTEEAIRNSVSKIGYKNILINHDKKTVFLKSKGMKIGFGGIGKGYAADKAKELLVDMGVTSGIINASGDMNAWGHQADGTNWLVGITNPLNTQKVFSWLPINNQSVVTSGDYEKYVEFNGKRYAHIINPRTGYPTTGIKSVTIFASKAELADALATSVFVMGLDNGLDFINQIKGIEAIIVDDANNFHKTKNIQFKTEK